MGGLDVRLKDRDLLRRSIGPDGLGISGRELARRAGLGQAIVGHLIGGRRDTCSRRTATRIEQALGCPSGLLFEEAPRVLPAPATSWREPG